MKCTERSKQTNDEQTGYAVDETVNWFMNNHESRQTKQGVRDSSLTNTAYAMKIQPLFAYPQLT